MSEPIWRPSDEVCRRAHITHYVEWLKRARGLRFDDYAALWQWSIDDLEAFWASVWDYFDVQSAYPYTQVLAERKMPGATWFPGAQLNYATQVFRHAADSRPAIVYQSESSDLKELGWAELERRVAAFAGSLKRMGIEPGDRVVAYLPNIPETVVAFLAVVSIGGVWSLCAPDLGEDAVLDRFRQIEPKLLLCVDGYRYNGKPYDRSATVGKLLEGLPTVRTLVVVPHLADGPTGTIKADRAGDLECVPWEAVIAGEAVLEPTPLPFEHPLWIVYSSGTTGTPKAIVHGQGGVVLEHLKFINLHNDIGADDRYHWYSSTAWVMWNLQVAGLLVGATICLYDGNPGWPDLTRIWKFADDAEVSFFGAGAAFYDACRHAGLMPKDIAPLARLRALGSTGSPLLPEAYRWIYDAIRKDIFLTSVSGGTDTASAFVGGVPTLPVYAGVIQCRCLGAAIAAFDDDGKVIVDEVGELVCTEPMPSMPLYFWNDENGERYRESYFDTFPGVWRHGDWVKITSRGGVVIYGRSDATINRHGIRMGTSELYRAVEEIPEVLDSLVVDLEYMGRESYLPLFVVLRPGAPLTDELRKRIAATIRSALSPRHVPDDVFVVDEIPRTFSGKKLEIPIRRLLLGQPAEKVINRDTMDNPDSIDYFIEFAKKESFRI